MCMQAADSFNLALTYILASSIMASFRCCTIIRSFLNLVPKVQTHLSVTRGKSGQTDERVEVLKEMLWRKKNMGPEVPMHRNTHLEWNYKAELFAFANRIGEKFSEGTLETALTQRSHVVFEEERQKELGITDPKGLLTDNQALALKGLNLMQDIVQRYLRTALPLFPEEGIKAVCDHLLDEKNLARIVSSIGAEELILCTDFPAKKSTLASTMCSLVGAVEDSSGTEKAALFIRDFIISSLSGQEINGIWAPENPFHLLSDIFARDGRSAPEPRLLYQTGVNTIIPCYHVGIYCDKRSIGSGSGETIEIATEQASLDSLWRMWGTADGKLQFPFRLDFNTVQRNCNINVLLIDWSSKSAGLNTSKALLS